MDGNRTTRTARRLGPLVAVALVGLGASLGACGGSSSSNSTTTTTAAATTTTGRATTSTAAGATTTTVRATPTPAGLSPWSVRPSDLDAVVGTRYSFACPAAGDASGAVWGVGPYTDDSSICTAAVHAGLITVVSGGTVSFDMQAGADSYKGSTVNGVTTLDYGAWPAQFVFVK